MTKDQEAWIKHWRYAVDVLTRQGRYEEAERHIREAMPNLDPDERHQAMIDLADTLRKPGQREEVLGLIRSAKGYFRYSVSDDGRYADAVHHEARALYRLFNEPGRAVVKIWRAKKTAISVNRRQLLRLSVNPRIVWIRLDYACINSILCWPWRARWQAVMAVMAAVRFWLLPFSKNRGHVNKTHLGRAWLIFRHASDPNSNNPLVQRAFWGKTP